MKQKKIIFLFLGFALLVLGFTSKKDQKIDYVDYVNPYMGNISHLLVPIYPTVYLPNSLLRVAPDRKGLFEWFANGKPLDTHWFNHSDLADGGKLVLEMGRKQIMNGGKNGLKLNKTVTPNSF
jgi:hypothetical protein